MTVRAALEKDLLAMPQAVRESARAESARVLADILDEMPGARDAASCAKELRAHLEDLATAAAQAPSDTDPLQIIEAAVADR